MHARLERLELPWLLPDWNNAPEITDLEHISRFPNLKRVLINGGSGAICDQTLLQIRMLPHLQRLYMEYNITTGGDFTRVTTLVLVNLGVVLTDILQITPKGLAAMLSPASMDYYQHLTHLSISIGRLDYTHVFTSAAFPKLLFLRLMGGTEFMYVFPTPIVGLTRRSGTRTQKTPTSAFYAMQPNFHLRSQNCTFSSVQTPQT